MNILKTKIKYLKLSFPPESGLLDAGSIRLVGNLSWGLRKKDARPGESLRRPDKPTVGRPEVGAPSNGAAGMTGAENGLLCSKMKKIVPLFLILLVWTLPSHADLDLDQEVLIIPDTHNEKPYIWNVARNPRGYELIMEYGDQAATTDRRFSFEVRKDPAEKIHEMHVFITDSDLHFFRHIRPLLTDGRYNFSLGVSKTDTFRFEIAFRTDSGWVNLKKDLRLKGDGKKPDDNERDKGYSAKVKLIPKKVYAEHVVTFLFDLAYNGAPIRDNEKIDGSDMQVAAWDADLKEFIYATPRQNLGGPEVAVSLVFMRPGRHAVFAEFKHNGVIRRIDTVVPVSEELRFDSSPVENQRPAD